MSCTDLLYRALLRIFRAFFADVLGSFGRNLHGWTQSRMCVCVGGSMCVCLRVSMSMSMSVSVSVSVSMSVSVCLCLFLCL